jgi:hypothetical protein
VFGRVQAQSRVIREASNALGTYASRVLDVPVDAGRAVNAVPGFMSAEAARLLAEDVRADVREIHAHLLDTAEVLADLAEHWELADAATAADFEQIAAALGRVRD